MNKALKEKMEPEEQFSNDPMMRDLHKTQLKISQQIKDMNGKELSDFFKKKCANIRK